jgi:hypothetical protein
MIEMWHAGHDRRVCDGTGADAPAIQNAQNNGFGHQLPSSPDLDGLRGPDAQHHGLFAPILLQNRILIRASRP